MNRSCRVRVTHNFEQNLADIRLFLEKQEAPQVYSALLERLFEMVIPNLERFPMMGVDFLSRHPQSAEGLARLENLRHRLGEKVSLREYITGDYLVLYAVRGRDVYLLSIKHHRQLSFDLKGHWVR
jgi:hypothetical protein